jgi:transposase
LDLRTRIIEAWQAEKLLVPELASRFKVGTATVKRFIRRFRETGSVEPLPHGGASARRYRGRPCSAQWRAWASLEKKSLVAKERNAPRIAAWREGFLKTVAGIASSRLVFVDETGTHTSMTREYARGPSGERVVGIVPRNRGVVLTVVGAVALDGVRAMMAYEGGTSAEAFLRFVREALAPSLHKGDVVVLDNLGAHRAVGVREAIETVGARLMYLPPYHPELNPIELAWSKMKALLKRIGARDLHALARALKRTKELLTPSDLEGWYHCGYEPPARCA